MTTAAQNSKQALAQKGTAGTPSFSFLGGNTAGMYLSGANQLGFSTSGAVAVTINSTGNVGIGTASPAVKLAISATDAMLIPVGTTGERPTGATGYLRYNTTSASFEGYNGTEWGSIGGGAVKGIFWENDQTVTVDYTITAGKNAGTFGPISVDSGVTVTVPSGSTWSIV